MKEILSPARTYQKSVITKKKPSSSWSRDLLTLYFATILTNCTFTIEKKSDDVFLVFETTGGIRIWDIEVQLYKYTKKCQNKFNKSNGGEILLLYINTVYIGIRIRCFCWQIVSFVNHLGHSYCSHCLYKTSIFYSLVLGPIFRLCFIFIA